MKIETNLQGRLRNTPLPRSRGLLPLFEAVVNSIHAVEEAGISTEQGRVHIAINRAPEQGRLVMEDDRRKQGPKAQSDIIGFTITDNGVGFNEVNMKAFKTLDTDHKASKGGRGGSISLDRMFSSLSDALRWSAYAAVCRVGRLSKYTPSGV